METLFESGAENRLSATLFKLCLTMRTASDYRFVTFDGLRALDGVQVNRVEEERVVF